jgi:N-methylhydantoinase A
MPLYPALAEVAIAPLAAQLGLSPIETALGIVEIANAHMARALRVISVERGHDPADFTLVSFGGAGGLHATALARALGIPRVLISPYASVFSALGMLMADVVKDYSQTVMLREQPLSGQSSMSSIQFSVAPLLARARQELFAEGIAEENMVLEPQLDVRLRGQSYELTIPFSETWETTFAEQYRTAYGMPPPRGDREIVNVRVHAVGRVPSPEIKPTPRGGSDPTPARLGTRIVHLTATAREIPLYDGTRLTPGNLLPGPALLVRPDTTILLGENDHAEVDSYFNLLIQIS